MTYSTRAIPIVILALRAAVAALQQENAELKKQVEAATRGAVTGRYVGALPLTGDETSLTKVKADPTQYIGKKLIVAGGIEVSDFYAGGYGQARRTRLV